MLSCCAPTGAGAVRSLFCTLRVVAPLSLPVRSLAPPRRSLLRARAPVLCARAGAGGDAEQRSKEITRKLKACASGEEVLALVASRMGPRAEPLSTDNVAAAICRLSQLQPGERGGAGRRPSGLGGDVPFAFLLSQALNLTLLNEMDEITKTSVCGAILQLNTGLLSDYEVLAPVASRMEPRAEPLSTDNIAAAICRLSQLRPSGLGGDVPFAFLQCQALNLALLGEMDEITTANVLDASLQLSVGLLSDYWKVRDSAKYVYFDLETTGLPLPNRRLPRVERWKPVEIVSITAWYGDEIFDELVNPMIPIPAKASEVHNIYDVNVANAQPWSTVGMKFLNWLYENVGPDVTLIAYNGTEFDMPLLQLRNGIIDKEKAPTFNNIWLIDPMLIAHETLEKMEKIGDHKQKTVYRYLFSAEPDGQHTSLGDVKALKKISEHQFFVPRLEANQKKLDGGFW